MAAISQKPQIVSCKYKDIKVEYHFKKAHLVGVVHETDKKIGKFLVSSDFLNAGKDALISGFRTLSLDRAEIDQLLSVVGKDDDSDDDFFDMGKTKAMTVFNRKGPIPASSMTLSCKDKNIKGSQLIEIVHEIIQKLYKEMIQAVKSSEKSSGSYSLKPRVAEGRLSILHQRDWLITLGGWKGMAASSEVNRYHFNSSVSGNAKFKQVEVFQNGTVFPIEDPRILITKNDEHFILKDDVTRQWHSEEKKPDLTYPRIGKIISSIRNELRFKADGTPWKDSDTANLQLDLLKGGKSLFQKLIPEHNYDKDVEGDVTKFLDFFNALIFGVEPSGINSALATGLMTLDLISRGKLSYYCTFGNIFGNGAYPYACFTHKQGSNEGTYIHRNEILVEKQKPKSMKKYREDPTYSPVAVKEAIIIKKWLEVRGVIQDGITQQEQIELIKKEVESFVKQYFH